MMDVKELMENETIKNLLDKFGVSEQQAESIANQAMSAIKSTFNKDPKQMSSLLSEHPNTKEDEAMAKKVEDDFLDRLTNKIGLPKNIADQAKGAIPGLLSQVSGKLSKDGANDEGGIAGMLGNITDFFDGDNEGKDGKKKSGGFLNKFFG